jgi:hypothetical protein
VKNVEKNKKNLTTEELLLNLMIYIKRIIKMRTTEQHIKQVSPSKQIRVCSVSYPMWFSTLNGSENILS